MPTEFWFGAVTAIFILMTLTFFVAAYIKRNDIADIVWGPGFLVAALSIVVYKICVLREAWENPRANFALGLVAIWAIRLAYHIGRRNLGKSEEDPRYKKWREEWGETWFWRTYLQVFLLQGLLLLVIDFPALLIVGSPNRPMDALAYIGVAVWIFGFVFEVIGDRQLEKFKKDPSHKGRIMDQGLWSWSRHPNYFGEVVQWWGLFFLAVPLAGGWLAIVSPLAITFLILKVSGVPMLEKQMEGRPGFEEYRRRTSIFFPLPPKK